MKATKKFFPVLLSILLYKVALSFAYRNKGGKEKAEGAKGGREEEKSSGAN